MLQCSRFLCLAFVQPSPWNMLTRYAYILKNAWFSHYFVETHSCGTKKMPSSLRSCSWYLHCERQQTASCLLCSNVGQATPCLGLISMMVVTYCIVTDNNGGARWGMSGCVRVHLLNTIIICVKVYWERSWQNMQAPKNTRYVTAFKKCCGQVMIR